MNLTLCGLSALRILRELRGRHVDVAKLPRVSLRSPSPGDQGRWSCKLIAQALSSHPCLAGFDSGNPLNVAVPSARERLRVKGVSCTIHAQGIPDNSFLDVGEGIVISGPELLFVELATTMSPEVHLLVGMELCGTFTRDAADPRNGGVTYQIPATTDVSRIRTFMGQCRRLNGMGAARESLEWLLDNAWSPMEAVIALMAALPEERLGYGLWPVDLNVRSQMDSTAVADSRVPDMLFRGTKVGLNYDGEGHLPLQGIVDAAMYLASSPDDKAAQDALDDALRRAREASVGDKRRDRDLGAAGLTVFALTKEDLYERGGLDRLMLQVIDAIERKGKRHLARQRTMMQSKLLSDLRQELIWSLLPGKVGQSSARTFAQLSAPNPDVEKYMKRASFKEGKWEVSLVERDRQADVPLRLGLDSPMGESDEGMCHALLHG